MEWLREDGGQRRAQSPRRERITWQDRDDIVPARSETLARTFNSERAKMASPLPTGSPIWESKNVPNTPLDAAKEQQYRDEVIRMLRGDSEVPPSPLQQAASGQKSTGGSERVSREVFDAALKQAVDQAASGERIVKDSERKRVSNGYRRVTTSQALLGNAEESLNLKRMSAENRAQAYEYRIQDLQNMLKTVRKAEAQAKQAEASAVAGLEALRKESNDALRGKDAELEGFRVEHEALKMAYDSLKTSMKGKSTDKLHASVSIIEKNELSALNEKLRSTSDVISALNSKVEQQREQLMVLEARCLSAEDRADALKGELELLQREHTDMVNNTESQTTTDRKHLNLAKDQIARMVAKHTSFEKAWTAKQAQLEKELAESAKRTKELNATIKQKDHELDDLKQEILKKLWKPSIADSGVQTEEVPNRWLWLLTLKIAVMSERDLQHEKEVQTDTVRIDGMVSGQAKKVSKGTQTNAEVKDEKLTEEDIWWMEVSENASHLISYLDQSKASSDALMSDNQALGIISALYAEKSIVDYLDLQNHRPLQSMRDFMWCYFLRDTGDKKRAEKLLVKFLANILFRIRQKIHRHHAVEQDRLLKFRRRFGLFARFLGFSYEDENRQERSPISSDGLNLFLQTLVRVRRGGCPLLEPSSREIPVPTARVFEVVDYVFAGSRSFERERIKTEIFDHFGGSASGRVVDEDDEVDLEVALEYVLMQYDQISSRWDSRLESLFAANDTDSDGSLDLKEFQSMMLKLNESSLSSVDQYTANIRMYAKMCIFPHVDASVFCKIAKRHRIAAFSPGEGHTPSREYVLETERACQRLRPLHKAASESMMKQLDAIKEHPYGPDLLSKWTLCEKLIIECKDYEMAWVIFNQATRLHSAIQINLKDKALLSALAQENEQTSQASAVSRPLLARKKGFSQTVGANAMFQAIQDSVDEPEEDVKPVDPSERRKKFLAGSSAIPSKRNGPSSNFATLQQLPLAAEEIADEKKRRQSSTSPLGRVPSKDTVDGRPKSPTRPLSPVRPPARMSLGGNRDSRTPSPVREPVLNGRDTRNTSPLLDPGAADDAGPRAGSPIESGSRTGTRGTDKIMSSFDVSPAAGSSNSAGFRSVSPTGTRRPRIARTRSDQKLNSDDVVGTRSVGI